MLLEASPVMMENKPNIFRRWASLITLFIFISIFSFAAFNYFSGSSLTAGLFNTSAYCSDDKGNSAVILYNGMPVVNVVTKLVGESSTIKKITYTDYLGELKIVMDPVAADPILVTNIKSAMTKAVQNLTKEQSLKIIEFSATKFVTAPFKCKYTK